MPTAKLDLYESRNWYNKQQAGLGKRFLFSVQLTFDLIQQSPALFAIRYQNMHTAPVRDFPFLIHYIVDDEKKHVLIIAVLHTSRDIDKYR
jgi:plasmid stabilization system protein ParE